MFKLHLNICWVPGMAQTMGTSIVFSVLLEILLLWVWRVVLLCFYSSSACDMLGTGLGIRIQEFKRGGVT